MAREQLQLQHGPMKHIDRVNRVVPLFECPSLAVTYRGLDFYVQNIESLLQERL
jgi:hypothetical protein